MAKQEGGPEEKQEPETLEQKTLSKQLKALQRLIDEKGLEPRDEEDGEDDKKEEK